MPPERGRYQGQNGGHQIEETIRIEDILGEGIQIDMGDPLEEEDP